MNASETSQQRLTYTVAEVAALLGVSERHVYELCYRHELPGVIKAGRRWLMPRSAFARLVGEREPAA